MKVAKRIFIKLLILLLVISAAGGGAAAYRGYQQSTAEYAVQKYLSMLIDNDIDKAYSWLDQSEGAVLTKAEFQEAAKGKKYSLYSSFTAEAQEKRRDNDGNEYTDYHVKFMNAASEVQAEEDFTVKKQSEQRFGLFDQWKVLGDHCMIQNFRITVPTGSTIYLDAQEAQASWMTREAKSPYMVCEIPQLLPGEISLTIRHPILESVNTTIDPSGEDLDYSDKMTLKESAEDECKEIGVAVLKSLLTASVKGQDPEIDDVLKTCQKEAEKFVEDQEKVLHQEDSSFKSIAVSAFAVQFGDLVFSETDGSIQTEMTFSYHYRIKREVTTVSEDQFLEDGTPVETVDTVADAGDSTAKMTMSYKEDTWQITALDIPVTEE